MRIIDANKLKRRKVQSQIVGVYYTAESVVFILHSCKLLYNFLYRSRPILATTFTTITGQFRISPKKALKISNRRKKIAVLSPQVPLKPIQSQKETQRGKSTQSPRGPDLSTSNSIKSISTMKRAPLRKRKPKTLR